MPYIDRDKLIKELSTMYKQPTSTEDFMTIGYDHAIADMVVTVYSQPTSDCVEVRCKDCAFWDKDGERKEIHMSLCCINQMYTFDYFYCDYGRRDDVRKPDSDDF